MHFLVFDTGIGGMGVASALRQLHPTCAITYVMDNAGFPYGNRQPHDIIARVAAVMRAALATCAPDVAVIACNTATTFALETLRQNFNVPFTGCVPPLKPAAAATQSWVIAVLATPATINGAYLAALASTHAPACRVLRHGAANLAQLAEHRFAGRHVTQAAVNAELAGLLAQPGAEAIDAVALGCTHYAWLLPELKAAMPAHVAWFDPAMPVAQQALRVARAQPRQTDTPPADLLLTTGHCDTAGLGFARTRIIIPCLNA